MPKIKRFKPILKANNLYKYRQRAMITQGELAKACGLSINSIYLYEQGKVPSLPAMRKITMVLRDCIIKEENKPEGWDIFPYLLDERC